MTDVTDDSAGIDMESLREGTAPAGPVEIDPITGLAQPVVTVAPASMESPWPWVLLVVAGMAALHYFGGRR